MIDQFKLQSEFAPSGDQPDAIRRIIKGFNAGLTDQTLLGATGTGKTFTMANVITELNRPTLILCHNKTLAAQLYGEFKQFFPNNAVEFFISFYDYYQPEAYVPTTDTFIEKDSTINEEIDRLRLKATASLLERRDVIVVASVSAIYGLGSPQTYRETMTMFEVGQELDRNDLFQQLVFMLYTRNEVDFQRGMFRVRGDIIDIFPAYDTNAVRLIFFGDELEAIQIIHPISGNVITSKQRHGIFPAKHFISTEETIRNSIEAIRMELNDQIEYFQKNEKILEAHRIQQRTNYDLEMLQEIGYCTGIENYSRYLDGRDANERPFCLFDFFPEDYLLFIDESHQTIPQIRGMYFGDLSRKQTLVEYGFRLPSALDNRPLRFHEFEELRHQTLYISATPSEYEIEQSGGDVIEQIIRPTGLLDPHIDIRPIRNQVDDLIDEIRDVVASNGRVLVTTLTKRMSEDLTDYLKQLDIRVKYLHSEIDAIERVELLRDLRLGSFDVLVGINLLREGLDLPEVRLVAILDADKEGFLRSRVSLLQTIGRAARNADGRVIMYADRVTESIRVAVDETNRRREKQIDYNRANGITPKTILKSREQITESTSIADMIGIKQKLQTAAAEPSDDYLPDEVYTITDPAKKIAFLEEEMDAAARELAFEKAAKLRDEIARIKAEFAL